MKERSTKYIINYIATAFIVSICCGFFYYIHIGLLYLAFLIVILSLGFTIMPMMLARISE